MPSPAHKTSSTPESGGSGSHAPNSPAFAPVMIYIRQPTPSTPSASNSPRDPPQTDQGTLLSACTRCERRPRYRRSDLCGTCLQASGYKPRYQTVEDRICADNNIPTQPSPDQTLEKLESLKLLYVAKGAVPLRAGKSPHYMFPLKPKKVETARGPPDEDEDDLDAPFELEDAWCAQFDGEPYCDICRETGKVLHPNESECLDCMKAEGQFPDQRSWEDDLTTLRSVHGQDAVARWAQQKF